MPKWFECLMEAMPIPYTLAISIHLSIASVADTNPKPDSVSGCREERVQRLTVLPVHLADHGGDLLEDGLGLGVQHALPDTLHIAWYPVRSWPLISSCKYRSSACDHRLAMSINPAKIGLDQTSSDGVRVLLPDAVPFQNSCHKGASVLCGDVVLRIVHVADRLMSMRKLD
jgi:hypothetical protein